MPLQSLHQRLVLYVTLFSFLFSTSSVTRQSVAHNLSLIDSPYQPKLNNINMDLKEEGQQPSLLFIENVGQFDKRALFQVQGSDRTIWLAEDGIWVSLLESAPLNNKMNDDLDISREELKLRRGANIKIDFLDANPHPVIEPIKRLDISINYFLGNDPNQWHTDVPVYAGVRYEDIYPDVDLVMSGENGLWYWECENTCDVLELNEKIVFSGAPNEVTVDQNWVIETDWEEYNLQLPGLLRDNTNTISTVQQQDGTDDLFFSTYLNGTDNGNSIKSGPNGDIYVTGLTTSNQLPTNTGSYDPLYNGYDDVFVAKLNSDGNSLIYVTYLGGTGWENARSIAVHTDKTVYVTGDTNSIDFPTTDGVLGSDIGGSQDAFVIRLNHEGSDLLYATYLGGTDIERGYDVKIGNDGTGYVTGYTYSADFPFTYGAYSTIYQGLIDIFVVRIAVDGSSLISSTYIGGSGNDYSSSLSLALDGTVYITGHTNSPDFPTTTDCIDPVFNVTLYDDAFVIKLTPTFDDLVFATYIGGDDNDRGRSISVSEDGTSYLTGFTASPDFPWTTGAYSTIKSDLYDAFLVVINSSGDNIAYATFLGGNEGDVGTSLLLGADDLVYISGYTYSNDFPTPGDPYDNSFNGAYDAFLVVFSVSANNISYSTYLGGSSSDLSLAMDIGQDGTVYLTGGTTSLDFPTTSGALNENNEGDTDAFITAFSFSPCKVNSIDFNTSQYYEPSSMYLYESGVDTVNATVNVESDETGTYVIDLTFLDILGVETSLDSITVDLVAGVPKDVYFEWDVPSSATLLDYDVTATIERFDALHKGLPFTLEDAIAVIDGPVDRLIRLIQGDCFSALEVCKVELAGCIPAIGAGANAVSLADHVCALSERGQNNDPLGVFTVFNRMQLTAFELITDIYGDWHPATAAGSSLVNLLVGYTNCYEAYFYEKIAEPCEGGYTNFACWGPKLKDVGNITSVFSLMAYEAPSTLALTDVQAGLTATLRVTDHTDGTIYIDDNDLLTIANLHGLLLKSNPNAQFGMVTDATYPYTIEIEGNGSGMVDFHFIHEKLDGSTAIVSYAGITTTEQSIASVTYGPSTTSYPLNLDVNGDGLVDETIDPSLVKASPQSPTGLTASVINREIQLSWTANPESDLAGYKVYYDNDISGPPYYPSHPANEGNSPIDVGTVTNYALTGLLGGTYYINISAHDNDALSSQYAGEVVVIIPSRIFLPILLKNYGESPEPTNHPPHTPYAPIPGQGATGQSIHTDLSWTGGDPDGDSVTYDVYLEAGDNTPDVLVCDDVSLASCDPGTLSTGTQYYWQIIARDEHGTETSGPVWEFSTLDSGNHPPNVPSNPNPSDGATFIMITTYLNWISVDPDNDSVTYDVYLEAGDTTPDVLVFDDITNASCLPGPLSYGTQYYWQVVARDEHGATAAGPIWEFTTMGGDGY